MVYLLLNATAMMGFERWTQLCLKGLNSDTLITN